jgi:SM-20-related protein
MSAAAGCGATVAAALARDGWAVVPGFLPAATVAALAAEARAAWHAGEFAAAGIGRAAAHAERRDIRADHIRWLGAPASAAQRAALATLEALRLAVNAALYLGLFDLECHFALYPPGAFYARHLDRFRDDTRRTVSVVLYLNEAWSAADGGALRLYAGPGEDAAFHDVLPQGGTLACFLSEQVYHEVLPTRRERLSLTGWFRRRA